MVKYSVKKRKGGKSQTFKNRNKQVGGIFGFKNRGIKDAITKDRGMLAAVRKDKGVLTGIGNWRNRHDEQEKEKTELKGKITEAKNEEKKIKEDTKKRKDNEKEIDEAVRKIIKYNTLIIEFNKLNRDKDKLNTDLNTQSKAGETTKATETSEKISSLTNELRTVLATGKSTSDNFIGNMQAKIKEVLHQFTDDDKQIINDRVAADNTPPPPITTAANTPPPAAASGSGSAAINNMYTSAFMNLHANFNNVSIEDFKNYLRTYITESSNAAASATAASLTAHPPRFYRPRITPRTRITPTSGDSGSDSDEEEEEEGSDSGSGSDSSVFTPTGSDSDEDSDEGGSDEEEEEAANTKIPFADDGNNPPLNVFMKSTRTAAAIANQNLKGDSKLGLYQGINTKGDPLYFIKTKDDGKKSIYNDTNGNLIINKKINDLLRSTNTHESLQYISREYLKKHPVKIVSSKQNEPQVVEKITDDDDGTGRYTVKLKDDDTVYNDYQIIPATAVDSYTAGGSKKGRNKTLKKRNKK